LVAPVASTLSKLTDATFTAYVHPTAPVAENTVIGGTLYDNTAGVDAIVTLQLRDVFLNNLESGGYATELALLCVASEWGTINMLANTAPNNTAALPNTFHYKGFFGGLAPEVFGNCADNHDGSYICTYSTQLAGEYVLRLAVEQPGLNATYFNSTDLGHLGDLNFADRPTINQLMGLPVNARSTISWTGDVGGPQGTVGDLGRGSYFDRFKSRVEGNIDFNWNTTFIGRVNSSETNTAFANSDTITSLGFSQDKFREEYWGARWIGRITPTVAEEYKFIVRTDSDSDVRLYIGSAEGNSAHGSGIRQISALRCYA